MAFSTQQNFIGVLDGTTVHEINKKIDYKKTKLEERKEVIEGILNGTQFFDEYFSEHFKASINAGDALSSNVNVCKSLERMANYLLNSDEIKAEEDAEKTKYIFHTDEKYFKKKMNREPSIESICPTANSDHEDAIIHFLKRDEQNYKKDKTQSISKKDLERSDLLGQVLTDYDSLLEYVTNELKKKDSVHNRYLLTNTKGQLVSDMIYTKDYLLGIFGYDLKAFSESTVYDLDSFDFTNEIHVKGTVIETEKGKKLPVKGLLYFKPDFDPNNEMSYVIADFQDTVEQANLTAEEKLILEGLRNGLNQEETAAYANTTQRRVSRTIDIITNKIIAVGNKYDG